MSRPGQELGVQRHLLLSRREGPRDLQPPFLLKDKPHLARRTKALGAGRTVGRARSRTRQRTEQVLMKEAALTARLVGLGAPRCHLPRLSLVPFDVAGGMKADHAGGAQPRFPQGATTL